MTKLGDAFLAIVPKLDDAAMSGSMGKLTSKLGGVATAGKVAFAAIGGAAATAAGFIAKSALDGYSSYEQNLGGVQKIFGNMGKSVEEYAALTGQSVSECSAKWAALEASQSTMLANASEAWQTAGLSSSAYMEQATSFGAALVSSLGGDTQRAAEYANRAIVDMADNANTFGTSIGDIQNAYQGFAKQNYTMLDNLKLGYGGTQSEMQRLISDASRMTDVQSRLGVTVDSSSMSFDNVVNAIHVMQDAMNVGGTTSREAATTIEGSVNSMKAAWDNWVTGLAVDGADMGALTEDLSTALGNVLSNVLPRLTEIVGTMVAQVPGLVAQVAPALGQSLAALFSTAVGSVAGALPSELQPIVDGFNDIVGAVQSSGIGDTLKNIFEGIKPAATDVASAVGDLASNFADTLGPALEAASPIIQTVADVITLLLTNIDTILPVVASLAAGIGAFSALSTVAGVISGIITAVAPIASVIGMVVSSIAAGAPVLGTLAAGLGLLVSPATLVIAAIAGVVAAIVAFATNAGGCRDTVVGAFQAIGSFVCQVPGIIGGALAAAVSAVSGFASSVLSSALSAGSNFLSGLSRGFTAAVNFARGIPGRILSALGNVGSTLVSAGKSIIDGFLSGIKQSFSGVQDFVGGIAGWIQAHKGPISYDRTLLVKNGGAIMASLLTGLRAGWGDVRSYVSGLAPAISGAMGEISPAATLRSDIALGRAASRPSGTAAGSDAEAIVSWLERNLGEVIGRSAPTVTLTEREERRRLRRLAYA